MLELSEVGLVPIDVCPDRDSNLLSEIFALGRAQFLELSHMCSLGRRLFRALDWIAQEYRHIDSLRLVAGIVHCGC